MEEAIYIDDINCAVYLMLVVPESYIDYTGTGKNKVFTFKINKSVVEHIYKYQHNENPIANVYLFKELKRKLSSKNDISISLPF